MNASGGIATILLAFPIYLLWRGRLPMYLALTKTAAAPSTPSGMAAQATGSPSTTSQATSACPAGYQATYANGLFSGCSDPTFNPGG